MFDETNVPRYNHDHVMEIMKHYIHAMTWYDRHI